MTIGKLLLLILKNQVFWTALSGWFVAGTVKTVINAVKNRSLEFGRLFGDGGMPSSHSSLVIALATTVAWGCGVDTPIFGLALAFAVITMHDAIGVRRETGKQAVILQKIAEKMNAEEKDGRERIETEELKVLVGHTPIQILVGALIGFCVGVLSLLICKTGYGSLLASLS